MCLEKSWATPSPPPGRSLGFLPGGVTGVLNDCISCSSSSSTSGPGSDMRSASLSSLPVLCCAIARVLVLEGPPRGPNGNLIFRTGFPTRSATHLSLLFSLEPYGCAHMSVCVRPLLRGVRLRNTSLSPPRLFPTLGSAPTNREPCTLTETWGEIAARGLGNVLTELSHIRVRELI